MSDESGQESKEEVKEVKESKEVSQKEESLIDESEVIQERLRIAEMKAQRFDKVLEKYNQDENFKKTFDAAWEGRQLEREANKIEKSLHENDDDPISSLKNELLQAKEEAKALRERQAALENVYLTNKISTETNTVANEYRDAFEEMAIAAGYEPGTPGFEILFDKVEKEGNNLAKRNGINPLTKFNSKLLNVAFKNTMSVMKKAGFDDAWQKKNEVMKLSKSGNSEKGLPSLDRFFTKERLKTKQGQVQAMEEAFRARINPDFKF